MKSSIQATTARWSPNPIRSTVACCIFSFYWNGSVFILCQVKATTLPILCSRKPPEHFDLCVFCEANISGSVRPVGDSVFTSGIRYQYIIHIPMQPGVSCLQISGQLVKFDEHSPASSIQHDCVCCRPTLILHEIYSDWWKLFGAAWRYCTEYSPSFHNMLRPFVFIGEEVRE